MTFKSNKKSFSGIILLAICATLFIVGLWPFSFWPKNEVEWISGNNGIHFYGQGIIYSPQQLRLPDQETSQDKGITIEILLQPEDVPSDGLPHILTFYDGKKSENLILAQWKSGLVIRSKNDNPNNNNPYKEIGMSSALPKNKMRFVTVTSGEEGTSIYLDGIFAKTRKKHRLNVNDNPLSLRDMTSSFLILGNSSTGKNQWKGNIFGLAIYNNSLNTEEVLQNYMIWKDGGNNFQDRKGIIASYLFNAQQSNLIHDLSNSENNLLIPATFTVLQKIILNPPWNDFKICSCYLQDIIINITGFIPLGLFFPIYLWQVRKFRSHSIYSFTILLGIGISLSIEILQVYLPARSSSSTDLITNTLGTTIGVVIFHLALKNSSVLPTRIKKFMVHSY